MSVNKRCDQHQQRNERGGCVSDGKRIIPDEWFYFEDWLKERAERAKKTATECGESSECYEHYAFVRNEWTAHIANTFRKSES